MKKYHYGGVIYVCGNYGNFGWLAFGNSSEAQIQI
jgi:hypothetical protein